jgi:hypothetical protein
MAISSLKTGVISPNSLLAGNTAAFYPTNIANLKAWYDASDTATITASGSAVTQWNDKSGNAFNVTQGTSAQRPVTGTRTQNGLNMIDFQSNDLLQAATASDWTFMSNATGCTVFVAAFYDTDSAERIIYTTNAATTANVGHEAYLNTSDVLCSDTSRGVGGTLVSNALALGTLTDNTAKYFSLKVDNANATAANRLLARINNGAETGGNVQTGTVSTSAPATPLFIGAYNTSGGSGFNGGICEMIFYSGILSDADILKVNNYLAAKWAI